MFCVTLKPHQVQSVTCCHALFSVFVYFFLNVVPVFSRRLENNKNLQNVNGLNHSNLFFHNF